MKLLSLYYHRALLSAVCFFLLARPSFAAGQGGRIGEKLTFTTGDGVKISCLFKAPQVRSMKTFVLLHGLGSNQEEWQPFVQRLVAQGYGFLSYDARGHGDSTLAEKGRKISYETFGAPGPDSMWGKMVSDLDETVRYLEHEKNIPAAKIVLAGASLGANVCLIYGTMNPAIPAVIALSPGLNYAGHGAQRCITGYTARPIAISVSPGDTYAYQSSMILYKQIEGNKKAALIIGNGGHGVQMFDGSLERKLLQWVQNIK